MLAVASCCRFEGASGWGSSFREGMEKASSGLWLNNLTREASIPLAHSRDTRTVAPATLFPWVSLSSQKGAQKIPNNWIKQRVQIHARYLNRVFYEAKQQHKKGFCFLSPVSLLVEYWSRQIYSMRLGTVIGHHLVWFFEGSQCSFLRVKYWKAKAAGKKGKISISIFITPKAISHEYLILLFLAPKAF